MAESLGSKGEISELPLPRLPGSSILAEKAGKNLERGEDEPARKNQDMVEVEAESSMDEYECAGRKGNIGEKARLPPRLGLVQKSINFLKRGKDIVARLYQRGWKSGDDGPARLNQDPVKLKAEPVMAGYAATKGKRVDVSQRTHHRERSSGKDGLARLNQDTVKLKAESVMAGYAATKAKRAEDEPVRLHQRDHRSGIYGPARLNQDTVKLKAEPVMAGYAATKVKTAEDEPARLYQREWRSGKYGPARLNQDPVKLKAEPVMAGYAATKGKRVGVSQRTYNIERSSGKDGPARLNQDPVKLKAEPVMAGYAATKGKRVDVSQRTHHRERSSGKDGPARLNQDPLKLKAEPVMAGYAATKVKRVEEELVRMYHRERSSGKDEPARLNQDTVKLEAVSSMAGYAATKGKRVEDEPVRLNQDKEKLEAVSSMAGYAATKGKRVEDEPVRLNQDTVKLEAVSNMAGYAAIKGKRVEDEPAWLNQDDVILSFSKNDGFGFVDSLCRRLVVDGIRVFIYDGTLPTPTEELQLSVDSANIYIPIFSRNYAGSFRCLEALALMIEHTSRPGGKKAIMPVFYNVERSDVQLEKKSLSTDALDTHKQSFGDEKVERWKKALVEAGKFMGWERSSYDSEEPLISSIVGNILNKLMIKHNYVFEDLSTGDNPTLSYRTSELEDCQESKIMELLELEVNDVRIVGIHGRDGIGKTDLAKIIYDHISLRFDACSFLAEIEETTQQPGGVQYLQTKFIFDILKREYEVASTFKGARFLKEIFRNMKVLIVLDDVERGSLLKEFVGAKLDWFGSGSRIIVTSKERSVLQGFLDRGLARSYDVIPMHHDLAFNFFWHYAATGKSDGLRSYVKIAIKIVKVVKGLPLLLKVFGSFLHDKGLEEWIKFKDLIKQFQEDYQKMLSIIYDALDQKQKKMYLDIACFPPDADSRTASYMWHRHDRPGYEIEVLHHMSLVKTEENKIAMHSMLRCLAREIIRLGFHDLGTSVGFYIPAIAHDTNKGKKSIIQGTDHLNTEEAGFELLPNTTFLSLGHANIGGQFADALMNVRWLHWQGCPRDAINIHLEKNENLVILDLSWSKVTESWRGWKIIKMQCLKVLNLTGCVDLLVTPSFSCCPNLEILILERCSRLVHLDSSINDLKFLVTLNLKFCTELSMLPAKMGGMDALEELLIDGAAIRELPESIGKLVRLQILSATNSFSLVCVPSSVCKLKALSVLALDATKVLELLESIGDLGELRRLSLRDCCGLGKLPESIDKLGCLVELDISGTSISRLPDSTKNLSELEVLKMDCCFLREFPRYIGKLIYMKEIHASWCRSLEGVIPSGISELCSLRELRLRGTRISSLPLEIRNMSSLHTLDLLHCDLLKELPPLPSSLTNLYVNPDLMPKT